MSAPVVAVLPPFDPVERAVTEAGGVLGSPEVADAIVWTDPRDPAGLAAALSDSPARWVQLPFAGIESFFAAGVIDAGRTWTCAKGVYGHATAEHALALMLAAARRLPHHIRARAWQDGEGGERRLAGTTAVILGTGGIGRALAAMLAPIGVRVVGVNRSGDAMPGADRTVPVAALAEAAREADWLVVAAAHTSATTGLVDATVLDALPRGAWVVNVARGPIVDGDALLAALRDGAIGGAALDVTDPEPLPAEHPLWSFDNVIITSHTANTRLMAIPELIGMVRRNVARFAAGEPLEGLVDPALGY